LFLHAARRAASRARHTLGMSNRYNNATAAPLPVNHSTTFFHRLAGDFTAMYVPV
jgi:hypothetical protein